MAVAAAFSAGLLVGGGEDAHAAHETSITLDAVPDDGLVELLARVEASADPSGGVAGLTFPDALAGASGRRAVPSEPNGAGEAAVVPPARHTAAPNVDPAPAGAYTVRILLTTAESRAIALRDQLRARGLPAWVGALVVDGRMHYRVALGGFQTEADASEAMAFYRTRVDDVPLIGGGAIEEIR